MNAKALRDALAKVPDDTEVVMVDFAEYPTEIKYVLSGSWPSEPGKLLVMLTSFGVHLSGTTNLESQ